MDHALGVRWHQLAMPVEHFAVRTDNDYAVVERAAAMAPVAFIDAAHDRHDMSAGGLAQFVQVTVRDINGVGQQTRV
ncbi:hypothetical protein D3C80_1055340 [compost metagenome]